MRSKILTLLFCGMTLSLTAAKCGGGESEQASQPATEEPQAGYGDTEQAPAVEEQPMDSDSAGMPEEAAPSEEPKMDDGQDQQQMDMGKGSEEESSGDVDEF